MEITTQIKLSKEDIFELIREKYDGDITFILEEETYKCGMTDDVQHYGARVIFGGVLIKSSKQETVKEAAEKQFPLIDTKMCNTGAAEEENIQLLGHRKSFIEGAKWQAERMYTYEEVFTLLTDLVDSDFIDFTKEYGIKGWDELTKWIQNKKKK
jgi:hypothetical protein